VSWKDGKALARRALAEFDVEYFEVSVAIVESKELHLYSAALVRDAYTDGYISGTADNWPLNLAANLAAAGMAATMMGAPCDCYEERGMFSECYVHIARRTMREAVS
jgi:hypothetical protein